MTGWRLASARGRCPTSGRRHTPLRGSGGSRPGMMSDVYQVWMMIVSFMLLGKMFKLKASRSVSNTLPNNTCTYNRHIKGCRLQSMAKESKCTSQNKNSHLVVQISALSVQPVSDYGSVRFQSMSSTSLFPTPHYSMPILHQSRWFCTKKTLSNLPSPILSILDQRKS